MKSFKLEIRYTLGEISDLLKDKTFRLYGESIEYAENASKSVQLEKRLTKEYKGDIRFSPIIKEGYTFSEKLEYYSLGLFTYKGNTLGY